MRRYHNERFSSLEKNALDNLLYECIRQFNQNAPLINNLAEMFSQISRTFEQVYYFRHCQHLFINPLLPESHILTQLPSSITFYYRKLDWPQSSDNYRDFITILQRENWLRTDYDFPKILPLISPDLDRLLSIIDPPSIHDHHDNNNLIVPFDFGTLNLGLFILWGTRNPDRKNRTLDQGKMSGQIAVLYRDFCDFLRKEYRQLPSDTNGPDGSSLTKRIYLPSFNRAARWTKVAVLFADIQNFTAFTEILRNINIKGANDEKRPALEKILNDYFEAMANIIQKNRGQIDRFFGAGIIAIFVEQENQPVNVTRNAFRAAIDMVKRFSELKEGFYKEVFGDEYQYEFNESVEIHLGIGIDYGTVLFDYFGDERHKEYTAAGDHVNFARMLGYEACRFDPQRSKIRPNILFSRTVYQCIKSVLIKNDLPRYQIHSQDRNYPYFVYGADEGFFKENLK